MRQNRMDTRHLLRHEYFAKIKLDQKVAGQKRKWALLWPVVFLGLLLGLFPPVDFYNQKATAAEHILPTTKGTVNNLVLFVRFSDQLEFPSSDNYWYHQLFNATGPNEFSIKHYFREVSYEQLTVNTSLYPPTWLGRTQSYKDSHPRSYYLEHDEVSNPDGYRTPEEKTDRILSLVKEAMIYLSTKVPQDLNIDINEDGIVDSVMLLVRGPSNDYLFKPRMALWSGEPVKIRGKAVQYYLFVTENRFKGDAGDQKLLGTTCHELYHILAKAPDFYRWYNFDISPVGHWDLMANENEPPQHMGIYSKHKYGGWVSSIPTINKSGGYILHPLTSPINNGYRINSPYSEDEYYIVEYRKKVGIFEQSLMGEGLLVYRINSTLTGNGGGPPDEVYIYRPGGRLDQNGLIDQAAFSVANQRNAINDSTDPSSFLSDGQPGGLNIYNIVEQEDTITFYVSLAGKPQPDFIIKRITLDPPKPTANTYVKVLITIHNKGAASGKPGLLRVWRDKPDKVLCTERDEDGYLSSLGTFAPGETKRVEIAYLFAPASGQRTFRAMIDSDCEIAESGETNNQKGKGYTVRPPPPPDFIVQDITLDPAPPITGRNFMARVTVKNRGAGAGSAGWLGVWADKPAAPTCGEDPDKKELIGVLPTGGTRTVSFSLPAGSAGDKKLRVFVDPACRYSESNENNNIVTKRYKVREPDKPDLVIRSITLNPETPAVGTDYAAAVTVKNRGAASGTTGGTLCLWLDQALALECSAAGADKCEGLKALAPGEVITLNLTNLPAWQAGANTLRAFVDSTCIVSEENESNNQLSHNYSVSEN